MSKIKLQYLGSVPTRILTVPGGKKIDVQPNEVVDVEQSLGEQYISSYKGVWVREEHAEEAIKQQGRHEKNVAKNQKQEAERASAEAAELEANKKEEDDIGHYNENKSPELPEAPEVEGELKGEKVKKAVPTKSKSK